MKYNSQNSISYKVLFCLVIVAACSFIISFHNQFAHISVSKTLLFFAAVELALPFYLNLCLNSYGFSHLKNPVVYAAAGFLVLSFISALVGVNFSESFWGSFERMTGVLFLIHGFLFLIYLLFLFRNNNYRFNTFVNIFISLGVLNSLLGITQQFTKSGDIPGRSAAVFGNPIYFAAFLVIPLFLAIYEWEKQQDKEIWYGLAAVVIFSGILTTKTAGALLGVVLGVFVSILVYYFGRYKTKAGMIVLGILAACIILGGLGVAKVPALKAKFKGNDAHDRLVEWRVALRGFKEKPILGVGPENFTYLADKYFDNSLSYANAFFDKPHNALLEVLVTTGVVGFTAYIVLIGSVLYGFYRLYKKDQISWFGFSVLVGGMIAYHVQNFFVFDTIGAFLTLTLLYAYSGLGFEIPEHKVRRLNKAILIFPVILAAVLLVINFKFARTDIKLTDALKNAKVNAATSEKDYEDLINYPGFADQSRVAIEYANFLINTDPAQTATWIPKSINFNQKVYEKNPSYYYRNELFTADLYFLKSQLDGKIDPRLYDICKLANKVAPNRVECDLDVVLSEAYEKKFDQAGLVMDRIKSLAPQQPAVPWVEIYVDSLQGNHRLVLDKIKEQMISHLDPYNTQQLDKIVTYYQNLQNFPQATAIYNEVIMLYPQNAYFYLQLAKVYVASGNKNTAVQLINSFKEKYPHNYQQFQAQFEQVINPQ